MRQILASFIALGVLALAPSAQAEIAGTVESMTGENGSVLVVRDGEIYSLSQGDMLLVGDIVATRTAASVLLSLTGCSINLAGTEQIAIGPNSCVPGAVSSVSVAGVATSTTVAATGPLLLGAASLTTLSALAAAADDEGDDLPVSP